MKKVLFILLSVFSFFCISVNVNAFSITAAFGAGGVLKYTYDSLCMDNTCYSNVNTDIADYDSSVSIFDKYGHDINLIANCDNTYYLDVDNNIISTSSSNNNIKLCSTSSGITLNNIKKYFNYYIHIVHTDEISALEYDEYLIFVNKPYVKTYSKEGYNKGILVDENGSSTNLQGMVIRNYRGTSNIHVNSDNVASTFNITINGNIYSGETKLNGFIDWYDNSSITSFMFNNHSQFDIYNLKNFVSNYITIDIFTNFDLTYFNDDSNIFSNQINGFVFNTDNEVKLAYEEYGLFIPKKNIAFSSYLWTDSNFMYNVSNFNINSGYEKLQGAGLDEIHFGYLNGFNWFKWIFSFSSDDLNNNMVLMIYNHNEDRTLNIKYFSEDFEFVLMNKDSSCYLYNGICYSNNWEQLKRDSANHSISNKFTIDIINNSASYINSLPKQIVSFVSAFGFLGTMISSVFDLFPTEIMTYFYVLFGFILIMIVITIMK